MEAVKTHFILHIQQDQHRAGKANGKPRDIDQGIYFVVRQIAKGNFKIVPEHRQL